MEESASNVDGRQGLLSRVASAPTIYWVTGCALGYFASERMSWSSGESYGENALKWHNLPLFIALAVVCMLSEILYRAGKLRGLRSTALIPFIAIQLRFALWLLYYSGVWILWCGTLSAVALSIAAIKFAAHRTITDSRSNACAGHPLPVRLVQARADRDAHAGAPRRARAVLRMSSRTTDPPTAAASAKRVGPRR
ncbi:hypothetical protein [Rhodococcus sp. NPDC058514]|uniref:hypothetical protein n=1 Tax=unclassified Rhodococcus (in: high G+C Gram-positive bacteria) TaxID=192944 RepID=UPI0036592CDA